jgi:hypothetical protein
MLVAAPSSLYSPVPFKGTYSVQVLLWFILRREQFIEFDDYHVNVFIVVRWGGRWLYHYWSRECGRYAFMSLQHYGSWNQLSPNCSDKRATKPCRAWIEKVLGSGDNIGYLDEKNQEFNLNWMTNNRGRRPMWFSLLWIVYCGPILVGRRLSWWQVVLVFPKIVDSQEIRSASNIHIYTNLCL